MLRRLQIILLAFVTGLLPLKSHAEDSLREAAENMPAQKSAVRVNQAGYLLDGPKRATIVSDAEKP